MAKRKSTASRMVASAMRRRKRGTLKSGSGATVRSRKQAVAIGLNEAREKGADVPPPAGRPRRRSSGRAVSAARRSAGAKTSSASTGRARQRSRKR